MRAGPFTVSRCFPHAAPSHGDLRARAHAKRTRAQAYRLSCVRPSAASACGQARWKRYSGHCRSAVAGAANVPEVQRRGADVQGSLHAVRRLGERRPSPRSSNHARAPSGHHGIFCARCRPWSCGQRASHRSQPVSVGRRFPRSLVPTSAVPTYAGSHFGRSHIGRSHLGAARGEPCASEPAPPTASHARRCTHAAASLPLSSPPHVRLRSRLRLDRHALALAARFIRPLSAGARGRRKWCL